MGWTRGTATAGALSIAAALLAPSARAQSPGTGSVLGPESERRSTGLMVTGIVLTGLGSLSSGWGGGMMLAGVACGGPEPGVSESDGCGGSRGLLLGLGAIWLAGGTAGIAAGVPMWVVGAQPASDDDEAAWARPQVAVGPGSARVGWRF